MARPRTSRRTPSSGKAHGIPNVVRARNGDMVRLFPEPLAFPGEVRTASSISTATCSARPTKAASKAGAGCRSAAMIVVSLCIDSSGQIVSGPELVIEGLPEVEDDEDSLADARPQGTIDRHAARAFRPSAAAIPKWSTTALQRVRARRGQRLLGQKAQRHGVRAQGLMRHAAGSAYIAIYFVVWWLCLFLVLPFGVRNQVDAGEVIAGTDPGAPVVLRLWRKLLAASLLSVAVCALLFWLLSSPVLQEYWR